MTLPTHPFDPVAPAVSADVPMLIGTTRHEASPSLRDPQLETLTEEELGKCVAISGPTPGTKVGQKYGENSGRIIEAVRRLHPDAKPIELLGLISGLNFREPAVLQAARKEALGRAPAYSYLFAWQTPVLDGRPRAFHGLDLPFAFSNTDRCDRMTGGGAEARELAAKMSDAWIAFARQGDPNHRGLPPWPTFSAVTVPTMVFDSKCALVNDPDGEVRRILSEFS